VLQRVQCPEPHLLLCAAGVPDFDSLYAQLEPRLQRLDALLSRLSVVPPDDPKGSKGPRGFHRGSAPLVSHRELTQARSQTGLSSRIHARLLTAHGAEELDCPSGSSPLHEAHGSQYAATAGAGGAAARAFLDNSELLEHMLSFVVTPGELARLGAVCTSWYLASRMHTLWEGLLRASGRLVGDHTANNSPSSYYQHAYVVVSSSPTQPRTCPAQTHAVPLIEICARPAARTRCRISIKRFTHVQIYRQS